MAGGYNYGGSSSGGYSYGSTGTAPLSPVQRLQVQAAKNQAKNAPKGILSDLEASGSGLFHGSTSALGAALGYLMRPSEGVSQGLVNVAQHPGNLGHDIGQFVGGFHQGLSGKSHATFSDFIRAEFPKFAAHHKTLTALGGLAGTILTDPTLPLIVGAQAVPGVDVTVDEAEAARLASLLGRGATSEDRAAHAQAALDAIDKVTQGATDTKFSANKALAQMEIERAAAAADGKVPNFASEAKYAMTSAAAKAERDNILRNAVQLKYSIPFSGGKSIPLTPTMIAGKRVAPVIPSLKGVAKAGVPLVSKTADFLGEAFKHGWNAPELEKPSLIANTKAKQFITDAFMRYAHTHVSPFFKRLSEQDMLKALDYGETRDGIVRASSQGRTLNERMLAASVKKGELLQTQADFLAAWHGTMEHLRQTEAEFGIVHEGSVGNKVYVPHRFLREGQYVSKNSIGLKTNFGFAKERQNLTLKQLMDAADAGRFESHGLELVRNPAEILGRRVTEAGDASAQHALADVLAHISGVPTLIPDTARRSQALGRVRQYMKKQRTLTHVMDTKGTKASLHASHNAMILHATRKILRRHQPILDHIDEQITQHMEAAGKAGPRVPPASKARGMSQKAFRSTIQHFSTEDRVAATAIHARMVAGKNLEARLAKIKDVKGGPQNKARKLAEDVGNYTGRTVTKGNFRGASWKAAIHDELFAERKNLQHSYNDLSKKYQSGKAYDHGKAIKRLMGQRERTLDKAAGQIDHAKFRIHASRQQALEEWEKTFNRQSKQYSRLQSKIEKEQRAYGAMKRNPNIPSDWIELPKKLAGGRYHFPPDVHAALTKVEQAQNNVGVMRSITNGYRKLLGAWKIGATSANPGYRVRNTASDIWNMYIAGVPMPRVVQYGKKAAELQVVAHRAAEKLVRGETDLSGKELKALHLMAEMQLHGILSGLFQGDIQEVSRMFHSGTKARDYLKSGALNPVNLGKAYIKATQDWNRHAENWGRITHYLYRRMYQGLSPQEASDWVKKAHFDYEELTPFEQRTMKAIFPFYTWTRKNIPFQLEQMISRPGKYAAFGQGIVAANELATGNPHTPEQQAATLPSWMRQNYMFPIPGMGVLGQNAYLNPNIGVQDLADLEHPISQGIGQHLNPAAQVLAAVLTGKNPGTGQDIVGTHPRNPVSGVGADILRLLPGANVGPTTRQVNGQTVSGTGANPWYLFAGSQLPFGNFLFSQESNIKQAQRGSKLLAPLSYVGGASVYDRDLANERISAQLDFANSMKQVLRGARDTGTLAQSKPKKPSKYQLALNNLIVNGG